MTVKTQKFTLPAHWASYLINGDASSFSLDINGDIEVASIDEWTETNNLGFCLGCEGEPFFARTNDVDSLACENLVYEFEVLS